MLNLFQHLVCFLPLPEDATLIPVHPVRTGQARRGFQVRCYGLHYARLRILSLLRNFM